MSSVSCIIPFYNEGTRILRVLEAVKKCPLIEEIICVDDGSTDNGSTLVTTTFPDVTVVKFAQNFGKSTAIQQGILYIHSDYVVLLDADLLDLDESELTRALTVAKQASIDMIIFRMKHFVWLSKIFRGDLLVSGQRIIRSDLLQELFANEVMVGYELEMVMNDYAMRHKWHVGSILCSAQSLFSIIKYGVIRLLIRDMNLYPRLIFRIGIGSFIKQVLFFRPVDLDNTPLLNAISLSSWK